MRASRQMLSELRRAFWSAWLLGGCICVLTLLAAGLAAKLFDVAVPLVNARAFFVLIALVAACIVAIAAISFVRDLILCRAGLWLHHELGRTVRSSAGQNALGRQEVYRAISALDVLAAFSDRATAGRMSQALWLPVYAVALYFIAPAFVVIAVSAAMILVVTAFWLARRASSGLAADVSCAETLRNPAATEFHQKTALQSVADWEHANCSFVAASYARHKTTGLVNALVLIVRGGALLAALGLVSWWSAYDGSAVGVVAAGLFLLDRSLAPICAVASAAATVGEAGAAYRALSGLTAAFERKRIADRKADRTNARLRQPDTPAALTGAHRLTQPASQALH